MKIIISFLAFSLLFCSSEVKESKKDDSFIDCAESILFPKESGKLIIKVESKDESFHLQNVSLNFARSIPLNNTEEYLYSLSPLPLAIPMDKISFPNVRTEAICNPKLNLNKDSKYEIQLPIGEYYASISNKQERNFSFEPDEDKLILFMFGYFFDKERKRNIDFKLPCKNNFERYHWGDYLVDSVRTFNACPKIKIKDDSATVITIRPTEKRSTDFLEVFVKYVGIVVLDPFTNRGAFYYNMRNYEVNME